MSSAYEHCLRLADNHYENFPVASCLLPKRLRQPIAAIYAFARTADDIADEGDFTMNERLARLAAFEQQLSDLQAGKTPHTPIFIALQEAIAAHQLPYQYFFDLLTAFKQDVVKNRYHTFEEVLHYCQYSANPVGRLLLHLHNQATPENVAASDAVCTALQLINFLQDIQSDYCERNRIYLPQQDLHVLNISCEALAAAQPSAALSTLITQQLSTIRTLLQQGELLKHSLHGRFGLEIRLIMAAAQTVVNKLERYAYDFSATPRLRKWDYLGILWRAVCR